MSIHVALNHVTHYRYDRPVALGPHLIRLRPAPHSRTPILAYSLKVDPAEHFINWQQDPQSNWMARLVFPEKASELRIEVDLIAEMSVFNPFDFFLEPYAEQIPFAYDPAQRHELAPYLECLPLTPLLEAYLAEVPREPMRSVDFLVALNTRVQQDIGYLIRMEAGVQTPDETLTNRSGSCRDSTWLLVQLFRHLGLAARFASGYLIQLVPDVKSLDGPSGAKVDFTDLHAWCEVYLPGAGWIGLDPTSGLFAGEGHIPLACTPDPGSAAPVTGATDPCESVLEHVMTVTRVWEAPRVTKPYTELQWQAIDALGHAIDADLEALDVRLTMGGEPTFVSMDDPDGAEWNTAALGVNKRKLAARLFQRLRERYAPNGLAHFGQGKWYPSEQLPRWSMNCLWRRDDEPVWLDPALYADESQPSGADAELGGRFLAAVAARLGLAEDYVFPAYEDALYYVWRERQLPGNVDPADSRLKDPLERQRLRKAFEQGLGATVGHVLPIMRNEQQAWVSGYWYLRDERCYLVPGDSSIGYRLPLDSLPWVKSEEYPYVIEPDPLRPLEPLPTAAELHRRVTARATSSPQIATGAATDVKPALHESARWITRHAMCAQARNGTLYVFMPPTEDLAAYLELVAAIEETAAAFGVPVMLEGYEAPFDARVQQFRVTPDPGVIEVNIHPGGSWQDLAERTQFLYETAHETRLITEKFMIDGRHTGTGGGNHFTLGAASPTDSPFLRRPDLLRSLISYWHNHPSLSFLFSGLFIGPTSQAPRIDEARNDSVYELEIAFAQLPPPGTEVAPWLVDRLLRNLLIDVTGNTHRAEFCIDKLYSPDGATGRLGLLEMRAFEMPPHARMSLAQQLLLRALVARFWKQPYQPQTLVRWGTALHDRFLLPHFAKVDFNDVLEETANAGYPIDPAWFAPHFEFRFPKYGDFAAAGIDVELRHALEPWHVLGEEGAAGGAVRYVDSSVERLQVKVRGMTSDRYVLTCNGRRVPLAPTGEVGEFVAGVRYRAWQPPNCLHPTIPPHAPLVFDLLDTWMSRSMGGCQYHVTHPGGRSYEHFPVNSYEAESRRLARFFRMGHTAGAMVVPPLEPNPNFPYTLDLRR
ncbi:MAG: DUF2126 domain-containing protein [Janthinobacterium lividum]